MIACVIPNLATKSSFSVELNTEAMHDDIIIMVSRENYSTTHRAECGITCALESHNVSGACHG